MAEEIDNSLALTEQQDAQGSGPLLLLHSHRARGLVHRTWPFVFFARNTWLDDRRRGGALGCVTQILGHARGGAHAQHAMELLVADGAVAVDIERGK
eukprot:scaffold66118_cov20-Tisochrysis_lutea.AAC.3